MFGNYGGVGQLSDDPPLACIGKGIERIPGMLAVCNPRWMRRYATLVWGSFRVLDLEVTSDLGFRWEPVGGPEGRQDVEGSTLVADMIMPDTGGCGPSSEVGSSKIFRSWGWSRCDRQRGKMVQRSKSRWVKINLESS